jgi:hypothetical protein
MLDVFEGNTLVKLGFRAGKAWACWDAARRVNPQHPMLLPVAEMESGLRTTFPEFF